MFRMTIYNYMYYKYEDVVWDNLPSMIQVTVHNKKLAFIGQSSL